MIQLCKFTSREKIGCSFDNAFQLADLCLAKEEVVVKDKSLYLTCSDLLRKVFFIDRVKAAVIKLVF